jgi:hypothetical protein
MEFDLTESVVREYLRDHSGTVYCAACVCRALEADVPPRAVSLIMVELAERRPPFMEGLCGCGAGGLMYARPQ